MVYLTSRRDQSKNYKDFIIRFYVRFISNTDFVSWIFELKDNMFGSIIVQSKCHSWPDVVQV